VHGIRIQESNELSDVPIQNAEFSKHPLRMFARLLEGESLEVPLHVGPHPLRNAALSESSSIGTVKVCKKGGMNVKIRNNVAFGESSGGEVPFYSFQSNAYRRGKKKKRNNQIEGSELRP
jgi:uncharacterized protein (DUF2249 family)